MDVPSSSKGKKKAKQDDTSREPNWTVDETAHLLNAVEQLQDARGRVGFGFNTAEQSVIYEKFKEALPRTVREKGKIINRTKVLVRMYKVCHDLANRSGGGWDDENHRPIAPSEAEYVEMVKAKGDKGKFLLKNNFPWYRQMEGMVGGQSSRGEIRHKTYGGEAPIHRLLTSQMSIQVSEQGSSDDPDEGNHQECDTDSVQPPVSAARSSYNGGARVSSTSGTKTNGTSGTKRKSTSTSEEPSSKGKTFRERYTAKRQEQICLANAGFELARVFDKNTIWKMTAEEQEDKCIELFDEWGIVGRYHDFCMDQIKHDRARRKWFLKHEKHVVLEWVERNIGFSVPAPNPTPNSYVPNQSYSVPNPAFNYPFINPNP